jgi:acetyl esterase/lipase
MTKITAQPSIESKLIQLFMGLFGMKRAMEKKIANNSYNKVPASIPKSILKKFNVDVGDYIERKVWTVSPKSCENNIIILYLHGGAYYANITQMHWHLIEQLLVNTNATVIVPDYPLAPESNCENTYQFLDAVYAKISSSYPSKQIVFMGDSAGGGLALGFAQKIRNEKLKQPEQIILFSPWLDLSMSNPEIVKFDKFDKILSIEGLKIAGKKYADAMSLTDFRVSPIYGDFSTLGKISIFTGTNDVLIADARKLKQILEIQNINLNYFEYSGMFHDWVVVTSLRETKDVLKRINELFVHK